MSTTQIITDGLANLATRASSAPGFERLIPILGITNVVQKIAHRASTKNTNDGIN